MYLYNMIYNVYRYKSCDPINMILTPKSLSYHSHYYHVILLLLLPMCSPISWKNLHMLEENVIKIRKEKRPIGPLSA